MRKLGVLLCLLIAAASGWAQDDIDEPSVIEPIQKGAFGGAVLKLAEINDEFGLLIGGHGGWIINPSFSVGGGFYGLLRDIEVEGESSAEELELGYGGLELEYVVISVHRLHLSAQTLIGFGGLTSRVRNFSRFNTSLNQGGFGSPDDSIFIVEPGLHLLWDLSTNVRFGLGGTHRFIRGVGIEGLENSDLSGASMTLTFTYRFVRGGETE